MGLFDFLKKQKQPPVKNDILLSMPIFANGETLDLEKITAYLRWFWKLEPQGIEGDSDVGTFTIDGEVVAIALMPTPIPSGDIVGTAQYAYNWPHALEELENHTGHAIVSIMSGSKSPLDRFTLLTKVLHAVLATSNAIGVYQGTQSLLISRSQYLENAVLLLEDKSPVMLWIYIGLRESNKKNSAYTYGLTHFHKQEIEVIDSALSLEDLYDLLQNINGYIVGSDVTFKDGETIGMSADQKIPINSSKGIFVDGVSLKLQV